MEKGILIVKLTTGSALPVEDAVVRVRNALGELVAERTIPRGSGGKSDEIELDVPDLGLSFDEEQLTSPYGLFNVEVLSGNFSRAFINGVQVFPDRRAILEVNMQPLEESFPSGTSPLIVAIPPNRLRLPPQPEGDISTLLPQSPSSQLHTFPYIPEYIVVHLGVPSDFSAKNVTVTFQDYIKNVASSEIYPTWPESAIRANILAQISFVLNRVYTEWYRSRGYDFDITNNTAFDQYFVEGRNIFENINEIVDEMFNMYINKEGREEPFFASYCNGTTSTCDGLSQWGTVTLANDGLDPEQILEYYYGPINVVTTNNIQGPFESFPGTNLTLGSRGAPVRLLQEQLNRIALNYPAIPFVSVDGIFGPATQRSVRQFQEIFSLTPDGVVGKATWYAISRVYVAVKNLAELTSEGERFNYASQAYPGTPIRLGARSTDVLELQLYLSTIALYNNEVKTVAIDGVFGESTLNSVVSFQRSYGLDPDGAVGEATWQKLVDVYNGIVQNVNVPTPFTTMELMEYPDTLDAESYRYVRGILNTLSTVIGEIPFVNINGEAGEDLRAAVRAFQRIFSLEETGELDRTTWQYLNSVYSSLGTFGVESPSTPSPAIAENKETSSADKTESEMKETSSTDKTEPEMKETSSTDKTEPEVKETASTDKTESEVKETSSADKTEPEMKETASADKTEPEVKETASADKTESEVKETASTETKATEKKVHRLLGLDEPFERPLRTGSVGTDVEKMKKALFEKGYLESNAVGGDIFGISTRRAVERFQADNNIRRSGRVDEETWREIFR